MLWPGASPASACTWPESTLDAMNRKDLQHFVGLKNPVQFDLTPLLSQFVLTTAALPALEHPQAPDTCARSRASANTKATAMRAGGAAPTRCVSLAPRAPRLLRNQRMQAPHCQAHLIHSRLERASARWTTWQTQSGFEEPLSCTSSTSVHRAVAGDPTNG